MELPKIAGAHARSVDKGAVIYRSGLYHISGVAAVASCILLLAALIDLIVTYLQPGMAHGMLSLFGDNWLVTIFEMHAGIQSGQLYVFNLLDIVIMVLVGMSLIGLYAALVKSSKILSLLALAQPFLGMIIFTLTGNAGRSAVMGSVLVISLAMLRSSTFGKAIAYTGILASVLLLVGDLAAGGARSGSIAALTGLGYVLLMVWLLQVGLELYRRGSTVAGEKADSS
jgi:hypothetical protein